MDLALEYLARYLSDYAYLGLFLILSVGAFGFPIPEEIVLVAAGLFVAQGSTQLGPTLLVCGVGQVIGDLLLFAVGRCYGMGAYHGVLRRLVSTARLEHVKQRLAQYGLLVVFFGRYLTGIRPAVFLGAGASGIPVARFVLVDGLSALVSLLVWVLLGWRFSGYIEIVLQKVASAEEGILAAAAAVLGVLVVERLLVRLGRLREGSAPVRVTHLVRIPILVVTAGFAVLIARQHHVAKRLHLVDAAQAQRPAVVKDLGLLMEILPDLAPCETPVEVVFVGSRDLVEEALAHAGYAPGPPPDAAAAPEPPPELPPDDRDYLTSAHDPALAFWRSNYVYRSKPVWFGRFAGPVSAPRLQWISKALTHSHYAWRTANGPRLRRGEARRVLVAVLRDPVAGR